MEKLVEFSLRSFKTLNHDYVIKTVEILNFLPLINKSVTTEFSFLLLTISAMISTKTINILRIHQYFVNISFEYHLNTQ